MLESKTNTKENIKLLNDCKFDETVAEIFSNQIVGSLHDFKNHLSIIRGYSELLKNSLTPKDKIDKYLDHILASCSNADILLNQVYNFYKKKDYESEIIDLKSLVNETFLIFDEIKKPNIKLKRRILEKQILINVPSILLKNALVNLLNNASNSIEFGGTITLTTKLIIVDKEYKLKFPYSKNGVFAVISVKDTGCGIDKSDFSLLFKPYYSKKEGGFGIGLSNVYRFVKDFSGHINVVSKPGYGSKFEICFPLFLK